MTAADTIQHLKEAQALLRRDGWQQGQWGPVPPEECGSRCVAGALQAVAGGPMRLDLEVRYHLQRTILLDCPPGDDMLYLTAWNDTPGRTEAEVHDLIDRTIARLETQ